MKFNDEVDRIIKAAEDKKAFDIKVVDIEGISSIADYFIIISGNNERQAIAISDEIDAKMSEAGIEPLSIEGRQTGKWIILDYGDQIVHVFEKNEREFYNLEKLWIDAKTYDIN